MSSPSFFFYLNNLVEKPSGSTRQGGIHDSRIKRWSHGDLEWVSEPKGGEEGIGVEACPAQGVRDEAVGGGHL